MIDIHAHILPGVDDGSRNWEETLRMCQIAHETGIRHTVATPHFIPGAYTRGVKEGASLLAALRERLQSRGIPLEISLAAEIEPFPEMIQWIEEGRLPLYPSGRHILLESPMLSSPPWMEDIVRDLLAAGLIPILAHPERSPLASSSTLEKILKEGAQIQLDAGSLVGIWGKEIRKGARAMLEKGWVSYVASDSHREKGRNPGLLRMASQILAREWGEDVAQKLTLKNPERVLHSMV